MRLRDRAAVRTEHFLTMSAPPRNGVVTDDTFAAAFGMPGLGLVITSAPIQWAPIPPEV